MLQLICKIGVFISDYIDKNVAIWDSCKKETRALCAGMLVGVLLVVTIFVTVFAPTPSIIGFFAVAIFSVYLHNTVDDPSIIYYAAGGLMLLAYANAIIWSIYSILVDLLTSLFTLLGVWSSPL
jgi:hypothetical protein